MNTRLNIASLVVIAALALATAHADDTVPSGTFTPDNDTDTTLPQTTQHHKGQKEPSANLHTQSLGTTRYMTKKWDAATDAAIKEAVPDEANDKNSAVQRKSNRNGDTITFNALRTGTAEKSAAKKNGGTPKLITPRPRKDGMAVDTSYTLPTKTSHARTKTGASKSSADQTGESGQDLASPPDAFRSADSILTPSGSQTATHEATTTYDDGSFKHVPVDPALINASHPAPFTGTTTP